MKFTCRPLIVLMSRRFGNEHEEFFEILVEGFYQVSLSKGAGTLFKEITFSNKQRLVCEVRPAHCP